MLTIIEENQGITAGELRDKLHNPKSSDFSKLIDGAVKAGSIIVNTEKSGRGSAKKCHYTSAFWNETHPN